MIESTPAALEGRYPPGDGARRTDRHGTRRQDLIFTGVQRVVPTCGNLVPPAAGETS